MQQHSTSWPKKRLKLIHQTQSKTVSKANIILQNCYIAKNPDRILVDDMSASEIVRLPDISEDCVQVIQRPCIDNGFKRIEVISSAHKFAHSNSYERPALIRTSHLSLYIVDNRHYNKYRCIARDYSSSLLKSFVHGLSLILYVQNHTGYLLKHSIAQWIWGKSCNL